MMRFRYLLPVLAIVSLLGLPVTLTHPEELPTPIKALAARGATIIGPFDAPSGLQGYAARFNGKGIALYLTADGKHVLIGTLYDVQGKDLTRAPLDKLVYELLTKEMWARLGNSTWISDGRDNAPRIIYLFNDPNCSACNRFWNQARPWIDSGAIQMRHIIVGMRRADSVGKSAALLTAKQPEAALKAHQTAGTTSALKPLKRIPAEIQKQLDANLSLMSELGALTTPVILYLDDDGRLKMLQGLPQGQELAEIMGR